MNIENDVELIERTVPFQGHFRLARYRLRHRLYNGEWGAPITREVFERGHAVAILPYDPQRDTVVLIEQFRIGAYVAGRGPWLVEAIAGMMEPGETPEEVARREAQEEAGCRLIGPLERVARYFTTPGGSDEACEVYVGRCRSEGLGGIHGLAAEGEDIRVLVMPLSQALAKLQSDEVQASPAIVALLWLALNRDRLRQLWSD